MEINLDGIIEPVNFKPKTNNAKAENTTTDKAKTENFEDTRTDTVRSVEDDIVVELRSVISLNT